MNYLLVHSFDHAGAIFRCEGENGYIPVNKWGRADISLQNGKKANLGSLNLLLEEEKAVEHEDGLQIFVSHQELARLEGWYTRGLGLPHMAPFRLVIETHQALTSDNFTVDYGFTYPNSLPVSNAIREGVLITCGTEKYLLPDPMYSTIELLDKYRNNPITDMDQRFLWWGEVRELLPEDAGIGNFLRSINIVKPENFTVDFKEEAGDIQITPRFVFQPENDTGDSPIADLDEPHNIVPPVVHDEFVSDFLRHPTVKSRYALSEKWFVVLPPTLTTAIQTVREINNASIEAKRAFLNNPKAELRRVLEEQVDEEILELLFVETPRFLSERIKCLGIWMPKAGLFIKTETGQWLPEDGLPPTIGLPLDGGIFSIKTSEIPALYQVMKEAEEKGLNQVQFGDNVFPVNDKAIETVKKAAEAFEPSEQPIEEENQEAQEPPTEQPEPYVPLIYDHIEELGILVNNNRTRTSINESEPLLVPGVRLHQHQKEGLKWLKEHWRQASSGALLADDMGLGKTLQALAFMSWVQLQMKRGYVNRRPFLLVAPTGLLKNWENEAEKFLLAPGLGFPLKAHGPSFRALFNKGESVASSTFREAGWVITTYETLRDKIMAFIGVHWAIAVFDEVQKIKNPKAKVTDMAKSIKAELSLALTGTPVENSLTDLWCIADAVQPGRLQTLKEFAGRFMPGGKPGQEELSDLKDELNSPSACPLMLRRSKDEHWQERPDKHECLHETSMPEEQA